VGGVDGAACGVGDEAAHGMVEARAEASGSRMVRVGEQAVAFGPCRAQARASGPRMTWGEARAEDAPVEEEHDWTQGVSKDW
jgi:hypothetical protein